MPLGDPQLLINANRTREIFGTRHLSGKATNRALGFDFRTLRQNVPFMMSFRIQNWSASRD
jgi:hypothetical protein